MAWPIYGGPLSHIHTGTLTWMVTSCPSSNPTVFPPQYRKWFWLMMLLPKSELLRTLVCSLNSSYLGRTKRLQRYDFPAPCPVSPWKEAVVSPHTTTLITEPFLLAMSCFSLCVRGVGGYSFTQLQLFICVLRLNNNNYDHLIVPVLALHLVCGTCCMENVHSHIGLTTSMLTDTCIIMLLLKV